MSHLKPMLVLGLNSGTSMDGIDCGIFAIAPKANQTDTSTIPKLEIKMLKSSLYEFNSELKQEMQRLIAQGNCSLEELCRIQCALGEEFAQAALHILKTKQLDEQEEERTQNKSKPGNESKQKLQVQLIGSHGQTFWHAPSIIPFAGHSTAYTLQLGEPAIIAERTGIPVVADFRVQDMAAGGQGAPLVAFADQVLFRQQKMPLGILNIGGIANLTILGPNGNAELAFDTGPGNMLIDAACSILHNQDFDRDGLIAGSGLVNPQLLPVLLSQSYFEQRPPKTTGREDFGLAAAHRIISHAHDLNLSTEDLIATLTAFTAQSIARQYERFVLPHHKINTLILGGGGADNPVLCTMLREAWPHALELKRHEDFGISTKFKEALLFALLAYTTYFGIPNNVPACTGARRQVCLGKLIRPGAAAQCR